MASLRSQPHSRTLRDDTRPCVIQRGPRRPAVDALFKADVTQALQGITSGDPGAQEVVKRRYFIGLEMKEIAETMGVSVSTVERHWAYARAWLGRDLQRRTESS